MAFVRSRGELLTGFQENQPWSAQIDVQVDFVMVYDITEDLPQRIARYREKGYRVHVMSGCSWGVYQDYLKGRWDGREHWDEGQRDRRGRPIDHGIETPYLCPTVSFGDYLTKKLKLAVDAGAEAIHLEEPEFWDDGGYSPAFQREYAAFYGKAWQPPHSSLEERYRAARLKVYLYKRLVGQVSSGIKAYAQERYSRELPFYVPTHSLVNYTQWKILSPEAELLDIPTVDGYTAQVWTGTARVGNVYRGRYGERTFETAFLEYGIMQELVRGTGRTMWFLHDPVEDSPENTWEDFRGNYLKTVIASLLHGGVSRYNVTPWPTRVYQGVYPKMAKLEGGIVPGEALPGAKSIPDGYAALLCSLAQTLGNMDRKDAFFRGDVPEIGLFMSDTGLYQRTFPDPVPSRIGVNGMNDILVSLRQRQEAGEDTREESAALMAQIGSDEALFLDYTASGAFPQFFGLAMPLVKAGIPLRPVQLENVTRQEDYLAGYKTLILSYEFMKPGKPQYHEALARWVRSGGTLILVGDGTDPYHAVRDWWQKDGSPYPHLYRLLGMPQEPREGLYPCGKGRVALRVLSPARITLTERAAKEWVDYATALASPGYVPRNHFLLDRGPYRIASVMEECGREPLVLKGHFADLLDPDFPLCREKKLLPGENALLYDLEAPGQDMEIIGTCARIFRLEKGESRFLLEAKAAQDITVRIRLRLPEAPQTVTGKYEDGTPVDLHWQWDRESRTLLLKYPSRNQTVTLWA